MSPPRDRTLVAVCSDLVEDDPPGRVAPEPMGGHPQDMVVGVVPGLCRRPDLAAEAVRSVGAHSAVVVVCGGGADLAAYRGWMRDETGPVPVEAIYAGPAAPRWPWLTGPRTAVARAVLAGKVARVRVHPRIAGGTVRPTEVGLLDVVRGGLGPPPASAAINQAQCLGSHCQLCLLSCHPGALRAGPSGRAEVGARACDGCGACAVVCPAGAINVSGVSLAAISDEMGAILATLAPSPEHGPGRYGVLLHCSTHSEDDSRLQWEVPADWVVLAVPCVTMVQPGWLLALLARGADAVGVLACSHADGQMRGYVIRDRVEFSQHVLHALGDVHADRRVWVNGAVAPHGSQALPKLPDLEPLVPRRADLGRRVPLTEPAATADAIRLFASEMGTSMAWSITHRASPAGTVELDVDKCTVCGACARACPTNALSIDHGGGGWVMSWDGASCVPCGFCGAVCPEGAIRVDSRTDATLLQVGRTVLLHDTTPVCPRCGRPMANPAMADRLRERLGVDGIFLDAGVPRCPECDADVATQVPLQPRLRVRPASP